MMLLACQTSNLGIPMSDQGNKELFLWEIHRMQLVWGRAAVLVQFLCTQVVELGQGHQETHRETTQERSSRWTSKNGSSTGQQ